MSDMKAAMMATASLFVELQPLEWSHATPGGRVCPRCRRTPDQGHVPRCSLAAALERGRVLLINDDVAGEGT